jgi:uncharacterized protein with HEPN domain
MRLDEMDAARLWDMLTYAREIRQRMAGLTFKDYMADSDRRMATERRLEIIGEAARNVSRAFQDAHLEIPWRQMIGLRNVLAHEYGEIRNEMIFRIATNQIPALISVLEPLIPPPPEQPEPRT